MLDLNNTIEFCFSLVAERILNPNGHLTFSFSNNVGDRSCLSGLGSNLPSFNFDTGGLSGFGTSSLRSFPL